MKWQQRRIEWAQLSNKVVRVSTKVELEGEIRGGDSEDYEFGGVAILNPPQQMGWRRKWLGVSLSRMVKALWLKVKDWLDPAPDPEANMKVRTFTHQITEKSRALEAAS